MQPDFLWIRSCALVQSPVAVECNDDIVLTGHGPGHIARAAEKTKVRPLQVYHGKVGRGLLVELSVKHGPGTPALRG